MSSLMNTDKFFNSPGPRDSSTEARSKWKSTCQISSSSFDVSHLKPIEKDFDECPTCGGTGIYLSDTTRLGARKTYKICNCKG